MVYEWSLDVGPGGADCGSEALFLVTGLSHHSPSKGAITMTCTAECGAENDCFPPDSGGPTEDPLSDYGDLPDSYDTLRASGGAQHHIKVVSPFLGTIAPDFELDGSPTATATTNAWTVSRRKGRVRSRRSAPITPSTPSGSASTWIG